MSKYDKYINKLLREYDRLIVDTSTKPNVNDYNVLNIKSFSELVDVRDNLRNKRKLSFIFFKIIIYICLKLIRSP